MKSLSGTVVSETFGLVQPRTLQRILVLRLECEVFFQKNPIRQYRFLNLRVSCEMAGIFMKSPCESLQR